MSDLFKIAGPTDEPRASVVFVHGLGGHLYDTWRRGTNAEAWDADTTFWPRWLARDCEKLAVYSIGYDAPVSRLRGSALHLTDQAESILARVLADQALSRGQLIFIGHSLGGLVIKHLLRTAESTAHHSDRAADLLQRVERVAFLATPHSGSGLASWGYRLRMLVRPSEATACLVRNDRNLRDLNLWYRDWANGRGIAHLILTEAKPSGILGMIVPTESADPGLAHVRSVPIAADHSGICKPADDTSDIYVLVRDFISRPVDRPKSPLDVLPETTALAVVAELQRLGVVAKAADAGVGEQTVLELARRLKPNEELTPEQAVVEVSAAVDIAIDVVRKGTQGTNYDDLVDAVLAGIAEKTRAGDLEGAARDADRGFAEWVRAEAERRETSVRSGIALLEAGLDQDILRRDAPAAARRVEKIVALEHPKDADARFAALRQRLNTFHVHGRDKGINFHLLVAIEIARLALALAQGPEQRGGALIDLGNALNTLGERESGTAKLEDAVAAYREVLKEWTRARAPLQWAITQNNLGNALGALGGRESGTAKLEDAVAAYREALKERTRERVPLDWAATQNNLGNALELLGARESGTAKLEDAVVAYREALKEQTRERVPLDWAATQNNLGNALGALGGRESGTAKLEDAVVAYREALKERTRERVPLDWAATQNNLGYALRALGARESGTAKLEDAVAAYCEALKERTRERVPLDWARTLGNEGLALMHLAEQHGDAVMAETAFSQITTAFETMRDGGHAPNAAYYEDELPKARALVARLRGR